MITGIFIVFDGQFVCSNRVDIDIEPGKTQMIVKECYGKKLPELYQDVDCLIKYDKSVPLLFTANISSVDVNSTVTLKLTSELKEENANQLLATIANLI